jgi:poly-gamma-glutamate synthesis protein (capsule biosynthesis protein)
MTGRGVDQLFARASSPALFEPFVKDAREYVALAEQRNGRIARPVAHEYIWGDALDEWRRIAPDARIVNLETSITTSGDHDRGKEIHYRMHPANVACLRAASIDVCVLANNHVLDWGRAGLVETLDTLERAGLRTAGAGRDEPAAEAPGIVERAGGGRVLVYACGSSDSGIASSWAVRTRQPGVALLPDLSTDTAQALGRRIAGDRQPGDLVVVSLHWGSNWGYDVPGSHVAFAHALVDAGAHVVHGHSSHHARPIEIYRGRLILYGCGDFINDYEGIEGYEQYRDDLPLMYVATLDVRTGALLHLRLTPLRIVHMRLARASQLEATWLRDTLDRVSAPFGTRVTLEPDNRLTVAGNPAPRGPGERGPR